MSNKPNRIPPVPSAAAAAAPAAAAPAPAAPEAPAADEGGDSQAGADAAASDEMAASAPQGPEDAVRNEPAAPDAPAPAAGVSMSDVAAIAGSAAAAAVAAAMANQSPRNDAPPSTVPLSKPTFDADRARDEVVGAPDHEQNEDWQKARGFLWGDNLTVRGRVISLTQWQGAQGTAVHEYPLPADKANDLFADAARAILRARAGMGEKSVLEQGLAAALAVFKPNAKGQTAGQDAPASAAE